LKIALGTFARSGIEAQLGTDVPAAVGAALSHYAGKLKSGRPPLGVPQSSLELAPRDPQLAFELSIDAETEALLEQEAARQGTSVSQLAAHTVLVYLAELDFLAVPARAGAAGPWMH
jgi:hypothetical protein